MGFHLSLSVGIPAPLYLLPLVAGFFLKLLCLWFLQVTRLATGNLFLFPEDGTIAQVCDFFLALESLAYFLGVYQFKSSLATALRSVYKEPARVGGGMILAPPDSVCRPMGPSRKVLGYVTPRG